MKRKLIISILLLLPFILLTACNKDERPSLEDRINKADQLFAGPFEGVLERLESIDIYQQGTHQLATKNQGIIIVQSPSIDLNRYVGEEVVVKGELEKGIGNAQDVFSVKEIAYLDESKLAEKKEYENKLFGFRFSHPSTWLLDEGQGDLGLRFEEDEIISIAIFSDETDLDGFADSREDDISTEVTIGSQRALRFSSGSQMGFYVPNPPKKKIYLIKYAPVGFDDEDQAESQREQFYDLLDSFELIYLSQQNGEKCGGLKQVECPEEQICQLESDGKYAEGVCISIGNDAGQVSCPFIAPPTDCEDYRISEYSQKGCPTRYECVGEGTQVESASFRDLNIVDAGELPEDFESKEAEDEVPEDEDEGGSDEARSYEVPELEDITYRYENSRKGFSVLMPKTWYFASFGPVDGTLWKVGFSDVELEESDESLITLSLMEEGGGWASEEINGIHYVFDGPSDLKSVMEKMAKSVELSE